MGIVRVHTAQPIAANSPPDWRTSLGQIAVRIDTDDGLVGYGVGGGGLAGMHVIREVLGPLLVGRDPAPVDAHWQQMYDATLPFGRKGIAIMAVSGVDLALWDLRAKAAGLTVCELIRSHCGGRVSDVIGPETTVQTPPGIPTYTTVWGAVDPETAAAPQAVKLHVSRPDSGSVVDQVVQHVHRARDLIGPDRDLMIDAWMKWDIETTLAIAERIAPFNIAWIEEPLPADDLAGYEQLSRRSPVPIAGGEHEFTALAFRELIDRRLHHVLQPDVCWCGGMTALIEIYRMAAQAGLRVVPHRGAEVWGLHGLAALDPQPLAESGRPWMTWVRGQPPIEHGLVGLPPGPGFGVEIDDPALSVDG